MATDSSSARDEDEQVDEEELPTTGVDKEDPNLLSPQRIDLHFLGAHRDLGVIEDIMDAIVAEGERRGLIFSYGGYMEMPLEDVMPGSKLEQIVTGRPPRIQ